MREDFSSDCFGVDLVGANANAILCCCYGAPDDRVKAPWQRRADRKPAPKSGVHNRARRRAYTSSFLPALAGRFSDDATI
jgi:hypothetical protein